MYEFQTPEIHLAVNCVGSKGERRKRICEVRMVIQSFVSQSTVVNNSHAGFNRLFSNLGLHLSHSYLPTISVSLFHGKNFCPPDNFSMEL